MVVVADCARGVVVVVVVAIFKDAFVADCDRGVVEMVVVAIANICGGYCRLYQMSCWCGGCCY